MKRTLPSWVICAILCIAVLGPTASRAQLPSLPTTSPAYTVLIVGHGAVNQGPAAPMPLLKTHLQKAGENSTVVFAGNPFLPTSLPGVEAPDRAAAEARLQEQLAYLQDYAGKIILMPGEHDAKGRLVPEVRNQERFIAQFLKNENLVLPANDCPGPEEISLTDDLHLLLLDAQWLMPNRRIDEEEEQRGCEITSNTQILGAVDDILRSNEEKNLLVIANISPEMSGLEYRFMHRQLAQLYAPHPGLIHAEGTSNVLQHRSLDSTHYVSTGNGGAGKTPIKGARQVFSQNSPGLAKILYFPNGESWLEIWSGDAESGKVVHRSLISRKPTLKQVEREVKQMNLNFAGKSATLPASTYYKDGGFRRWFLGKNYRQEWKQPVTLPVFDIATEQGGLKVVQRGGGFQTRSLRLEDSTGRQYVLRSVEKYPDKALPQLLRETVAADIVKDQISASHPYGSLVVPTLADAAGVYHTNPKYFVIPDDPRFGRYLKGFANTIGLFEERPDEDMSDLASMGNAKNVVGTDKVLENTFEDQDDQVDQLSVLRARLLDFFIADWDRHDDQWRWAEYEKPGKGKLYKPIPRDRDQAFFVNQGVLPNIASRKWLLPKVQGFDESTRDIETFNFNARNFDRSFLTALDKTQWMAMADSVEQSLTDQTIDKAVKQLPATVYQVSGERLANTLKARRAGIKKDAEEYYEFLAKKVDVVGTDQKERFEVKRQPDGTTLVSMYGESTETNAPLYQRRFVPGETREVRLYGLGGNDQFQVSGQAPESVRVRIIGGEGQDQITDSSSVEGLRRLTYVYDSPDGAQLQLGSEARDLTHIRNTPAYDRLGFKYNYLGPLASIQYNRDDGLLLGAGALLVTQAFNKQPYGMSHRIMGSYAAATNSFLVDYAAHFRRLRLGLDLKLNVNFKSPGFADNFFGLSNESAYNPDIDIDYYRYKSAQFYSNILLGGNLGEKSTLFVGPAYQYVNVDQIQGRLLGYNPEITGNPTGFFQPKSYAGARLEYTLDTRNSPAIPDKGVRWNVVADYMKGVNDQSSDYGRVRADFSLYKTVRIPFKLTLATRFGGGHTFGDNFEFFQAQTLDGLRELRGYRRNRFSGESTLYNNTEARLRLFSFTTYLFPASLGLFGFHDVGRVWVDNENSNKWHTGYGGGIWIAPLNTIVISIGAAVSEEETLPMVKAGFLF